jgi:hypothetical protein
VLFVTSSATFSVEFSFASSAFTVSSSIATSNSSAVPSSSGEILEDTFDTPDESNKPSSTSISPES